MTVAIWSADFQSLPLKDMIVQAASPDRVTLVDCARTGKKMLCLTTQPGDIDIAFSGKEQRADVYRCVPGTADPVLFGEGDEVWWAHSIMFPDTFKAPLWHPYIVADWHAVGNAAQACLHVNFRRWPGRDDLPGVLQIQRWYGNPAAPSEKYVTLGVPTRNMWYDFLHHIIWSRAGGTYECWLNKKLITQQSGPTLFDDGEPVYMKLANYHLPWEDQPDVPSSVYHDRVRVGPTRASVDYV